MQVSATGIALIKEFEALRLAGYRDAIGVPTIGWGHTSMAGGTITYEDGTQTTEVIVGKRITREEAERLKQRDTDLFARDVIKMLTRKPLPHQLDAMVSLAFNIGQGNFKKSSVLRHFNNGRDQDAANAFLLWNKAGGKVWPGLTRRREAERSLYLGDVLTASKHAQVKLPGYTTGIRPPVTVAVTEADVANVTPDAPGTPAVKSTTIWSQVAAVLTTVGTAAAQAFGAIDWKVAAVITTGAVAGFAIWTISERLKARSDGR